MQFVIVIIIHEFYGDTSLKQNFKALNCFICQQDWLLRCDGWIS